MLIVTILTPKNTYHSSLIVRNQLRYFLRVRKSSTFAAGIAIVCISMMYYLGIDIGSTTIKMALIDEQQNVLQHDYQRHRTITQ